MHNDYANSRRGAPPRLGIAALLLGILIAMMIAFSGGASAAPGDADLSITKTDSPDSVVQGNNLTYTITVTNNGPLAATNVVVTDNLPAKSDVDFVSATSAAGSCDLKGSTVTCNLDTIANAGTATVTIVVKTKHSGTLSNRATVASPDDNTPANNSATATTTVTGKGNKPAKASCAAPTITGTAGDDVITGTSGADVIVTFTGNDQVFAGGGGDLVCTDGGADVVFGNGAGDTLIGGSGPDRLVGGKGGDLLKGKNGRDVLKGKAGNDTLNGGKKRDLCKGGPGHDVLISCP
jgi:uncharacterized repeat protein (TIGR01451 family)